MQGIIKKLMKDKGFGFILGSDSVQYFFHRSSLVNINFDELEVGQGVDFDPEESDKGPRAEGITV